MTRPAERRRQAQRKRTQRTPRRGDEALGAEASDAVDPGEPSLLDQDKLRAYELSRLRYFYAVVRCSSASTAHSLYRQLDGSEFESTANKLDLRFVPDDAHFDEADVRDRVRAEDVSAEKMAVYKPPVYVTKALQHSKVELTWDADDEGRKRLRAGKWAGKKKGRGEVDEADDDLRVYLASDDDDAYGSDAVVEASDDEAPDAGKVTLKKKARARYAGLLGELAKGEKGGGGGEVGRRGRGRGRGRRAGRRFSR